MESVIELVKFVGGLGGLASASFLIYDRVVRSRPSAFLFPADYKANIRFKNVVAETIIIDKITIKPPLLTVKRANDLKTSNEDKLDTWYGSKGGDEVLIIIEELGARTFAVHGVHLPISNTRPPVRPFRSSADGATRERRSR